MTRNHRFGLGLSCFTFGAAVGACVATLYTPHSGPRMRRLLWRKAEDAQEAAADASHRLAEKGREVYDRGAKFLDHAAGRVGA